MSPETTPVVILCDNVFNNVVLPAPEAPINAVIVPGLTNPVTLSNNLRSPPST